MKVIISQFQFYKLISSYLPIVNKLIGIAEKCVVAELAVCISEARSRPEIRILKSSVVKVAIENPGVD